MEEEERELDIQPTVYTKDVGVSFNAFCDIAAGLVEIWSDEDVQKWGRKMTAKAHPPRDSFGMFLSESHGQFRVHLNGIKLPIRPSPEKNT